MQDISKFTALLANLQLTLDTLSRHSQLTLSSLLTLLAHSQLTLWPEWVKWVKYVKWVKHVKWVKYAKWVKYVKGTTMTGRWLQSTDDAAKTRFRFTKLKKISC